MHRTRVGILLFDDVEILDFAGPFEVFSRTRLVPGVDSRKSTDSAPYEVFTVAAGSGTITTTGGLVVQPHYSFATAPAVDLLLIPGGFGTRRLLDDATHLEWIRAQAAGVE